MNILEKRSASIVSTKTNYAILNIPKSMAKQMDIGKGDSVMLTLTENGQLIIEKAKQEE